MKFQTLLLISFILFVGCHNEKLTKIDEDLFIELVINNKLPLPGSIPIKNLKGELISLDSLIALDASGRYFGDFYANKEGVIIEYIIREKTEEDDLLFKKITAKLNAPPKLKTVQIDCDDKINILQKVFDQDQNMRKDGDHNQIDPEIDHKNLEIIVSFLDQCGMPTLEQVNDTQIAAIWLVLQHAPPQYQNKYIPLLEKSAEKGDIKWSSIALMKDRALMHEGRPQIYGSQIIDGKLHDLMDPEYVNQRRETIGMEPIEDYLKGFGIEFNVEQKIK